MNTDNAFYKQYNLSKSATEEINRFLNFVTSPLLSSVSTPYNLLIDSDNENERISFERDLAGWLSRHNPVPKKRVCICSESEILEHFSILSSWLRPYFACIIEADGSAETDQLRQIRDYIAAAPNIFFIISTTTGDLEQRFKPDEHFFYRILPYHIHIGDVNADIISGRLLGMLEKNDFQVTDDFKADLAQYNSTVYPKADLKNEAYLQDLFRRVINNHLGSGNTSTCIEKESVPYYRKMPLADSKSLDVRALPLEEGPLPSEQVSHKSYNVLFMALSIFPKSVQNGSIILDRCTFNLAESDGSIREYGYYYQLEPVLRMLSMQFWKENDRQHIDKLILLCSPETTQDATICINHQYTTTSPCAFLRDRISSRLAPDTVDEEAIKTIPVDTDSPVGGIRDTVNYIRELKKKHQNLNLYVDRHGGFRSIQSAVNAMLSLLKNEITIKKIYDLNFNPAARIGTIVEADSHDLYDFVSGMNEFSNYGRIKSLEEFYGADSNDLMRHISTVSDGIQLCDIATFEKGISEINTYYAVKNEAASKTGSDVNESHAYLALFEDNIFEDYRSILEAAPEHKILEEIEWCRRKGFYQQALTLVESRMPAELKRCGVFSYEASLEAYANNKTDSGKFDYQSAVDFIFNQTVMYARNDTQMARDLRNKCPLVDGRNPDFKEKNAYLRTCYIQDKLYEKYLNSTNGRNSIANAYWTQVKFNKLPKAAEPQDSSVRFVYNNPRELFAFIHLHAAFKELRNRVNHASKDGVEVSVDSIDKALRFYYKHGKIIEEYAAAKLSAS